MGHGSGPSTAEFAEICSRLRAILDAHVPTLVAIDSSVDHAFTTQVERRPGERHWFGAVRVGKRYVSFYLMPVYVFPDLLDGVSPELCRRLHGKSCFTFTGMDEERFRELEDLTRRGLARYVAEGMA